MKKFSFYKNGGRRINSSIIFMILTVLIGLITISAALKGQTSFDTEWYGTTLDSALTIEKSKQIRSDFTIYHNGFQGVNVKFSDDANYEEGGTLKFILLDKKTDSVVARYTMELRKILPQIDVFVPLPYQESENKKVSLIISGMDLKHPVGIMSSNHKDHNSTLYEGSKLRRYTFLVFSAVYMNQSSISLQAVVKGILYFLILLLAFSWPGLSQKADKTAKKNNENELLRKETADEKTINAVQEAKRINGFFIFGRKWKRLTASILVMTGVYLIITVFFYQNSVLPYLEQVSETDIVRNDGGLNDNLLTIAGDEDVLEHYFTVNEKKLSSLTYHVNTECRESKAKLHIEIWRVSDNILYCNQYVNICDLPTEFREWCIYLDHDVIDSGNMEFLVKITPYGFKDSHVDFSLGEPVKASRIYLGGVLRGSYPILEAEFENYGYLKPLFLTLSAMLYIFLVMCCFLTASKDLTIEKLYIPVCLFLGIVYMFVIPVYSVPDEYAHIDTAYSLSNRILGIEQPVEMPGYDYRRECDVETEEYLTFYTTPDDYKRYCGNLISQRQDEDLTLCVMRSTAANVNQLYFLPAAMGITLGRILHLSTLPVYMLGRLFNLLTFVFFSYLGLKKIPAMKEAYFIYAALPIGLQQAASFSYDSVMDAVSLLFISYCFYIAMKQTRVTLSEAAVLLFTLVQMGSVKGGTYLPVCLFMFIIPLERGWNWIKSLPLIAMTGFCICLGFLQDNISRLLTSFLSSSGTRVSPFAGREIFTFSYLISHPWHMIRLYMNTFFTQGSRLLYEFFGGKMGSMFDIQLPWMYVVAFIVILTVAAGREKSKIELKKASKILCAVIVILVFGLIGLAMILADTSKTSLYIMGLQGRYFIPSMILLLFIAGRQQGSNEAAGNYRTRFMAYCVTHVLFIFNVVMIVLPELAKKS